MKHFNSARYFIQVLFLTQLIFSCAHSQRTIINSLEVVEFIDLNFSLEARIDTGATASTLHAEKIERYIDDQGEKRVRFFTRNARDELFGPIDLALKSEVMVRSSNGRMTKRPVVKLKFKLKGKEIFTRVSLYNRKNMQQLVLIGRESLKSQFLVNPDDI